MSGFDKSRFIDLSQSDCDEFVCGICLGILNNPVETKCCRKTYCKKCITTWINTNQLCPNDRRYLSSDDLMKPSLIITNLLSKLKIKCNNSENGCQQIVSYGSLSEHSKYCHHKRSGIVRNVEQSDETNGQERERSEIDTFSIIATLIMIAILILIVKILTIIITPIITILMNIMINVMELILTIITSILIIITSMLTFSVEVILKIIISILIMETINRFMRLYFEGYFDEIFFYLRRL